MRADAQVLSWDEVTIRSAGLLLYRLRERKLEVLLVHPGGPFWQKRDERAWSIPKGEWAEDDTGLAAARREFAEELGEPPPEGRFTSLGSVRQAGGKIVHAWAVCGDFDVDRLKSNTFELEWPPRSGVIRQFPEVDRAAWIGIDSARRMLLPAQRLFIDQLAEMMSRQRGAANDIP